MEKGGCFWFDGGPERYTYWAWCHHDVVVDFCMMVGLGCEKSGGGGLQLTLFRYKVITLLYRGLHTYAHNDKDRQGEDRQPDVICVMTSYLLSVTWRRPQKRP